MKRCPNCGYEGTYKRSLCPNCGYSRSIDGPLMPVWVRVILALCAFTLGSIGTCLTILSAVIHSPGIEVWLIIAAGGLVFTLITDWIVVRRKTRRYSVHDNDIRIAPKEVRTGEESEGKDVNGGAP